MAEIIPCDPATESLRHELRAMPLDELLFTYVEWAQRMIRPVPRDVYAVGDFWDDRARRHRPEIDALMIKIMLGIALEPHLSERVRRHGYTPKGSDGRQVLGIDWKRRDFAVNAFGVHHLHLRPDRSSELLFAVFSRHWAGLLLLGDHKSFHNGEVEDAITRWRAETGHLEIKGVLKPERSYTAAERTALARHGLSTFASVGDKIVLSSMISTAGTSIEGTRLSDRIRLALEQFDARLDDRVLTDILPGEHLIRLKGRRWSWEMHHCDLVLVEETTPAKFVMVQGPT